MEIKEWVQNVLRQERELATIKDAEVLFKVTGCSSIVFRDYPHLIEAFNLLKVNKKHWEIWSAEEYTRLTDLIDFTDPTYFNDVKKLLRITMLFRTYFDQTLYNKHLEIIDFLIQSESVYLEVVVNQLVDPQNGFIVHSAKRGFIESSKWAIDVSYKLITEQYDTSSFKYLLFMRNLDASVFIAELDFGDLIQKNEHNQLLMKRILKSRLIKKFKLGYVLNDNSNLYLYEAENKSVVSLNNCVSIFVEDRRITMVYNYREKKQTTDEIDAMTALLEKDLGMSVDMLADQHSKAQMYRIVFNSDSDLKQDSESMITKCVSMFEVSEKI